MGDMYPSDREDEYLMPVSKKAMEALRVGYPHRFPGETFAQYVLRHPKPVRAD